MTWGAVTAVSPLTVRLDGDPQTIRASGCLVGELAPGDRVWCVLENRRLTVLGKNQTPVSVSRMVGEVTMWSGYTLPAGWLLCEGAAVSRTTYADLFAVTGTMYGSGDGSTTFNLPNMSGRVPTGVSPSETEFSGLGKTGGEKTHTLTVAEMPSHTHTLQGSGAVTDGGSGTLYSVQNGSYYGLRTAQPASTGGGGAHNNLAPYLVVRFIIRAT